MNGGSQEREVGVALRIIDDAWTELRRSPYVQQALGLPLTRLPDLSLAEAQRRAALGDDLLNRASAIAIDALPHELALTLRVVQFRARQWSREACWYWIVSDPLGVGFYGLFLPTAYCGGFLLNLLSSRIARWRFETAGDLDRYLALAADFARMVDQMRERTLGQAQRAIHMPRPQIEQARALVRNLSEQARTTWPVAAERLTAVHAADFRRELERRIATDIEPAFDRLAAVFSDQYFEQAPETVGIGQYQHGAQVYAELVKLHTTLDLTPEQVHAAGFERIAQIESQLRAIREELGFKGDGRAFLSHLDADPRWRAGTVEGVAAVFERYIDRLEPHLDKYFALRPRATQGVAPLPDALQGSMTFGYYDAPRPDRRQGLYLFNGMSLTQRSLFNVGALTYHELVPGHHLHLATQLENEALHPFRVHSFVNAYNEGWAEYAATLAGEMGMYLEPQERYGRLMMDAFLTCRLVVDTGMNVLGWPLERARDYLREHSAMSEIEIGTETLRYACDVPAQSLAYKLGDAKMFELRERMQRALGARFDIRDFHSAVLRPGALPFAELDWHVEREIARLRAD